MKKIILFLYVLLFLLNTSVISQEFLPQKNNSEAITIKDYQRAFDEWAEDKDISQERGWKWYKRWESFQSVRVGPDGAAADPKIYYDAALKVSEKKKVMEALRENNSNWSPVGPEPLPSFYDEGFAMSKGRINCIEFHPTDSNIMWAGVAQGGVWKTTNGGKSWMPLTDDLPIIRISDIAVNPTDPDEMYISVGDYGYLGIGLVQDGRKRHTHFGIGVYKTTDGGQSWNPTGLTLSLADEDMSLIRRVFIHPDNTQHLVAAGIKGIWKSTDGGSNWTKTSNDLIWDIEKDPESPNVIYASKGFISSMNLGEAGILKTTDFGNTWQELNTGISKKNAVQRIELAIAPTDPDYIYAIACQTNSGFHAIYRSTDGGQSWNVQADSSNTPNLLDWGSGLNSTRGQGTYDLVILVDPDDKNKVFAGGINIWGSDDGGQTWDAVSYNDKTLHVDQHQLKYNPAGAAFFLCNDGGLYKSKNIIIGSWNSIKDTLPYELPTKWENLGAGMVTSSFYRLGLSQNNTGYVIAGAQDNSTFYKNSTEWYGMIGGDGMEGLIHPDDPDIIFGSWQYGSFAKSTDGGRSFDYSVADTIKGSRRGGGAAEKGEWTTPMLMRQDKPNIMYTGFGNVWRSDDMGETWRKISDFQEVPGLRAPNLITSIAISPDDTDNIYVTKRVYHGYDLPGEAWKTNDGGKTWVDITAGLPDSLYFTYMDMDDDDPNTVWVVCGGFSDGLKVFKSNDGGDNWQNISYNLPNVPVNCIVHEQNSPDNNIYIGTDVGIYFINDQTQQWELFSNNLPNVIVSELEIHYATQKLYAATFGRGIWMSDMYEAPIASIHKNSLTDMEISLSPNPGNGEFNLVVDRIRADHLDMEIVDITGRKVFSEQLNTEAHSFKKNYKLNLNFGMYFLRLSHDNTSRVVKFVVE